MSLERATTLTHARRANDNGFVATLLTLAALLFAFLAFFVVLATHASSEEVRASPGIYTPAGAVQAPPMRVTVIDATTFKDIETGAIYRLYGIDACAKNQQAELGRQSWPCGVVAISWLVSATLGKWTACNIIEQSGGTKIARCATAEHPDLAADMLRDGDAVTVPDKNGQKIHAYTDAEESARKSYRGLWSSRFEFPVDYRKNNPPTGAAAPPTPPQSTTGIQP